MPDYRNKVPKFLWGAAFANVVNVGYSPDNPATGPEPRTGSSTTRGPSGIEDAWTVGNDYLLVFDIRWIPLADTAVPLATGWDGATGFQEFLAWARDKNVVRVYPDAASGTFIDCYLAEPMSGQGDQESDGTHRIRLTFRNVATRFEGY